jgi:Holliday junction resolvase
MDTNQQPAPTLDDIWRLFAETDRKFQETDRLFKAQAKETKRLEELFTSQWGKLMESLVEGDIVNLLNHFGIAVMDTSTRVKGHTTDGQQFEFDIIAHNGDITVVIEVKTTLRPQYVSHFIDKLNALKTWLPRYANNTIYGAVAFLTADAGSEVMAEKLGLIVIRATGDSASIVNQQGFKPRGW